MARTRHRDRAEAFNLGAAGENAPDWVLSDPSLLAAFDQGQADGDAHPFHAPVDRAPAKSRPTKTSPGPTGAPATGQRTAAGSSPKSSGLLGLSAGQVSGANKARSAIGSGDGSGVLLAVLAYPMLLALAKGGPAEVVVWLKAKFLNRTPSGAEAAGEAPLNGSGPTTGPGSSSTPKSTNPTPPSSSRPMPTPVRG